MRFVELCRPSSSVGRSSRQPALELPRRFQQEEPLQAQEPGAARARVLGEPDAIASVLPFYVGLPLERLGGNNGDRSIAGVPSLDAATRPRTPARRPLETEATSPFLS
jgi:hypothetical protein